MSYILVVSRAIVSAGIAAALSIGAAAGAAVSAGGAASSAFGAHAASTSIAAANIAFDIGTPCFVGGQVLRAAPGLDQTATGSQITFLQRFVNPNQGPHPERA
jgi:hypothetical protein